jgi:hypothetical protein
MQCIGTWLLWCMRFCSDCMLGVTRTLQAACNQTTSYEMTSSHWP